MKTAPAKRSVAAALLGALALFAAAACTAAPVGAAAEPGSAERAEAPKLAGSRWQVTGMNNIALIAGRLPTLAFSADGRVSGSGGCNSLFGDFVQDGAKLTITGLGSTKMFCTGVMGQESAFTGRLSGLTEVQFGGGGATLKLITESGNSLLARRLPEAE